MTTVNPLTHAHEWGDWSEEISVPGTHLAYQLRGCMVTGCMMIVMEGSFECDREFISKVCDDAARADAHHIPSDAHCAEYLVESEWEEADTEGFRCVLPDGHQGAHRTCTTTSEECGGTHKDGREYEWAHEWRYLP